MDLYRLNKENPNDFYALDVLNVFQTSVALVEWSTRLPDVLIPKDRLVVDFVIDTTPPLADSGEDRFDQEQALRFITFTAYGRFWNEIIQTVLGEGYLDDLLVPNNAKITR
jgi:tRNA A37 threonylcarbamoyladenosine biosynthesis protein TsaE